MNWKYNENYSLYRKPIGRGTSFGTTEIEIDTMADEADA